MPYLKKIIKTVCQECDGKGKIPRKYPKKYKAHSQNRFCPSCHGMKYIKIQLETSKE